MLRIETAKVFEPLLQPGMDVSILRLWLSTLRLWVSLALLAAARN